MARKFIVAVLKGSKRTAVQGPVIEDEAAAEEQYEKVFKEWEEKRKSGGPIRLGGHVAVEASEIVQLELRPVTSAFVPASMPRSWSDPTQGP
jgi:hypothetical protein